MLRRTARYIVVLALLLSIGGHWVVLQSAAWAGMLVSYAMEGQVAAAVSKTFDGRHPCGLCKVVERGTQSSGKQQDSKQPEPVKKIQLFVEPVPVVWTPDSQQAVVPVDHSARCCPSQAAPLLAPPRAV